MMANTYSNNKHSVYININKTVMSFNCFSSLFFPLLIFSLFLLNLEALTLTISPIKPSNIKENKNISVRRKLFFPSYSSTFFYGIIQDNTITVGEFNIKNINRDEDKSMKDLLKDFTVPIMLPKFPPASFQHHLSTIIFTKVCHKKQVLYEKKK